MQKRLKNTGLDNKVKTPKANILSQKHNVDKMYLHVLCSYILK